MSDKFEIKDEEIKKVDGGIFSENKPSNAIFSSTSGVKSSELLTGINASNK